MPIKLQVFAFPANSNRSLKLYSVFICQITSSRLLLSPTKSFCIVILWLCHSAADAALVLLEDIVIRFQNVLCGPYDIKKTRFGFWKYPCSDQRYIIKIFMVVRLGGVLSVFDSIGCLQNHLPRFRQGGPMFDLSYHLYSFSRCVHLAQRQFHIHTMLRIPIQAI